MASLNKSESALSTRTVRGRGTYRKVLASHQGITIKLTPPPPSEMLLIFSGYFHFMQICAKFQPKHQRTVVCIPYRLKFSIGSFDSTILQMGSWLNFNTSDYMFLHYFSMIHHKNPQFSNMQSNIHVNIEQTFAINTIQLAHQ